jgi:hypothetical protein
MVMSLKLFDFNKIKFLHYFTNIIVCFSLSIEKNIQIRNGGPRNHGSLDILTIKNSLR